MIQPKTLNRIMCGLCAAAAILTSSLPVSANEPASAETTAETTPDVYIIETKEPAENIFDAVKKLDPTAELLYTYSEAITGFSIRTELDKDTLSDITGGTVHNSYRYEPASYGTDGEALMAYTAAEMLGASEFVNTTGLRGAGTVAAVIDAAFDVKHPMLNFSEEEEKALADSFVHTVETIAEAVNDGLRTSNRLKFDRKSPYVSQKVPYAYDYVHMDTDVYLSTEYHGTAVASVLAGNADDENTEGFDGIAPDAQLLLMKVSDDRNGSLDDYSVLAAIDDAISLGADVINLSFGLDRGFVNVSAGSVYFTAIGRARAKGIDVFCACGNEGRFGEGSTWDTLYGISSPDVLNPDYGRTAAPSTLNTAISVASVNNRYYNINEYIEYLNLSDGLKYPLIFANGAGSDICKTLGGRTLKFVHIPNLGEAKDFEKLDVKGKLALIERGTISFEEKINNAAEAGAVGVIVYNNTEESSLVNMAYEGEVTIPAVFISRKNGLMLIEGKTDEVTVSTSGMTSVEAPLGGRMAQFSSYGPTPALTLKPDLTAVGGNIRAASNDGGYIMTSGTSFSSPIAAGCALLLAQTVDKSDPAIGVEYISRMLMSTAVPITDPDSGTEYSPRRQGAGLINVNEAAKSGAYITGNKGASKLELGDKLGSSFDLSFTVRNFTEDTLSWKLGVSLLTDSWFYSEEAQKTFIGDSAYPLGSAAVILTGEEGTAVSGAELNRYNRSYSEKKADTITLGPLSTATFTLKVTIPEEDYAALSHVFRNGFYAEGYVYLTPTSDKASPLSVPYLGFTDSWADLPMFDESYAPSYLTSYMKLNNSHIMVKLGENTFLRDTNHLEPDGNSEAEIPSAISPDGNDYGDIIGMGYANIRNMISSRYEITDANGELVYSTGKADPEGKAVIGVDAVKYNGVTYIWDGRD
nr:S8 family serine peptidase [Clostridia bacterium]